VQVSQWLAGSSTAATTLVHKQTAIRVHPQAAFNLLVCSYALGDKKGMMAAFQKALTAPALAGQLHDDDEDDGPETDDETSPEGAAEEVLLASMLSRPGAVGWRWYWSPGPAQTGAAATASQQTPGSDARPGRESAQQSRSAECCWEVASGSLLW